MSLQVTLSPGNIARDALRPHITVYVQCCSLDCNFIILATLSQYRVKWKCVWIQFGVYQLINNSSVLPNADATILIN